MAQYGRYDPNNAENSSTLFSFQEVPVTSAKINRWNGNLAAGFELLHRICSALLAKGSAAVLTAADGDALKVSPSDPSTMTVLVDPGWAMLENSFAGITEPQVLPMGGTFSSPAHSPRIDLVVLSGNGELGIVEGAEASAPEEPSVPDDTITLARINHRVGATKILDSDDGAQSYIQDKRPRILLGEAHHHALDAIPEESPDGSRKNFSTRHVFREGSLMIFLNGVLQQAGVDYIPDANRRGYTFLQAPPSYYKVQHRYLVEYEVESLLI